jgi:tryptophan 6-halogenase
VQTENGDIGHVATANSGNLKADLFVDCTGFRRLLLSKMLTSAPVSYEPRLFNNSAVVIRTPVPEGNLPPYTEATALNCGWVWRIPLMNKISWGYVYSNNYTSQDAAEAELRAHIGDASKGIEPLCIRLKTGHVHEHWSRNCLAVGLSQGFIEPLEATALGLTQFTINRFVTHFARGDYQPVFRDHFNQIVNEAFDATINYIQMHYKLTTRTDTQYWRDCASNENISDATRELIAAWEDPDTDFHSVLRQHVHRSSYAPYSWYCILSGMGRYAKKTMGQSMPAMPMPYASTVSNYYNHRQYLDGLQRR